MKIGTKQQVIDFLTTAKDGVYKVCLHRYRRSIPQNSYLHVVCQFIEMHGNTGYDKDQIKELMRYKFLKAYSEKFNAEYARSTKSLDRKEMVDFIEKIRAWSLEFLHLEIPSPEDHRMIQYYNENPPS